MSERAEPTVDELVALAELRRQISATLPRRIAETTGVARDRQGLVEVTATASGELRDLRLHPAVTSVGGRKLGEMIVEAAAQATEFALQRCYNELAQVLGDNATFELEELMGIAPARAAGWDVVGDARRQDHRD